MGYMYTTNTLTANNGNLNLITDMGASVITGGIAHCNKAQPYELAVLEYGELCYDTPITDNVIGHLTSDEVYDLLDRIEQL